MQPHNDGNQRRCLYVMLVSIMPKLVTVNIIQYQIKNARLEEIEPEAIPDLINSKPNMNLKKYGVKTPKIKEQIEWSIIKSMELSLICHF
jgi:hypothetical protein